MYSRPIIFKAYSIIALIFSVISFIASIINIFALPTIGQNISPIIDNIYIFIKVSILIISIILLFFAYMDFSSMFAFGEMIEYETKKKSGRFKRMSFVFPATVYRKFGSAVFMIVFLLSAVAIIAMTISYSITQGALIAVPIIPIAIILINLLLVYITYYCKYKSFADVMDIVEKDNPSDFDIDRLRENKTNYLRGYCSFLFIMAFVCIAGIIVSMFFLGGFPFAVALTIGICLGIYGILLFIVFAIQGCYFDNLAKMVEHYDLEYRDKKMF